MADARGNDGDGLRWRGIAVEKLGVDGSIRPAGTEFLGAGSIRWPGVMAGIRGEIRREADNDGRGAEDIPIPIYDRSGWGGVDVDFLRLGLGPLHFGLGLWDDRASGQEQGEKVGDKPESHNS